MSPHHARILRGAAVRILLVAGFVLLALVPSAAAREVVVVLSDGTSPDTVIASAKIQSTRVDDRYTEALDGFSADLTDAQITTLNADARVVSINPNVVLARH